MESLDVFEAGVLDLISLLMPAWLVKPVIKPLVRLVLGLLIIPIFRVFLHRVVRKELNDELEQDISLWLRGSLLLLIATSNTEFIVSQQLPEIFDWQPIETSWWVLPLRLLLAITVIEGMPDQALFSIIHAGPPPIVLRKGRRMTDLCGLIRPTLRGIFNQHLSRSSAVFAILSVVLKPGPWVWVCYGLAITNYLIIGLMCSRDKALDVLSKFDQAVEDQRRELELAVLKHDQMNEPPASVPQPATEAAPQPQ